MTKEILELIKEKIEVDELSGCYDEYKEDEEEESMWQIKYTQ